jgi:hypothetical protein
MVAVVSLVGAPEGAYFVRASVRHRLITSLAGAGP